MGLKGLAALLWFPQDRKIMEEEYTVPKTLLAYVTY
jgi:hypothetical protein